MGFFSRFFGRRPSTSAEGGPLWMTAADFADVAGISARGARRRIWGLLALSNGERAAYEREVPAPRGGGLAGRMKEYNLVAIARDFPRAISSGELSRAREYARDPASSRHTNQFVFHPGNDGEENMTDETKDTPAAPADAGKTLNDYMAESAALVARIHELLKDVEHTGLRRSILKAALQLLNY